LATESLMQGRDLHRRSKPEILLGALLIIFLAGSRFRVWSWRMGLVCAVAIIIGAEALAIAVQWQWPVLLDTSPWILATLLAYGLGLTRPIEHHRLPPLAP